MPIPTFKDRLLLITALTHRSALNEHASAARESNERLEYLGDAVLELITTDFLYHQLPNYSEGQMTALRATLVKTTALAQIAREINLGDLIYVSRGEDGTHGRANEALLADTLEAVIGALYLDQGLEAARHFIQDTVLAHFDEVVHQTSYKDAKSRLQEKAQSLGFISPKYVTIDESGPDHNKNFVMAVFLGGEELARGEGHNKHNAQQVAAQKALDQIAAGTLILHPNPAKSVL